jgi:hypothetical protein
MASADEARMKPTLHAKYASPKTAQSFEHPLPAISPNHSTAEKTAYLSALRSSVVKLQEEINVFLTRKMDEDSATGHGAATKVYDEKEEENYGEEVVEEDS